MIWTADKVKLWLDVQGWKIENVDFCESIAKLLNGPKVTVWQNPCPPDDCRVVWAKGFQI